MRFSNTPEMDRLKEIFKPYEEGCHLVENAPTEAVEAKNRFMELFEAEEKKAREFM